MVTEKNVISASFKILGFISSPPSENYQGPSRGGGWRNVVSIIAKRYCVVNYMVIISYPFMDVS